MRVCVLVLVLVLVGSAAGANTRGFTDFLNNLWSSVFAPALNETGMYLAGTAAQILAGISVLGIPGLEGRDVDRRDLHALMLQLQEAIKQVIAIGDNLFAKPGF